LSTFLFCVGCSRSGGLKFESQSFLFT